MLNTMLYDPEITGVLSKIYFTMAEKEDKIPTVPGLALALGFNRSGDILNLLKSHEAGTCPYPEESVHKIMEAVTQIEDIYLQGGMKDKFPIALIKFCLGSYHGLQEKAPATGGTIENQNIQIVFESPKTEVDNMAGINPFNISNNANAQPVIELNSE